LVSADAAAGKIYMEVERTCFLDKEEGPLLGEMRFSSEEASDLEIVASEKK
jgi:hypothetical protein